MPVSSVLDEKRSEQRSSICVSGAARYDALGKVWVALEEAGVEPSFESAIAMMELAFLNLRAAGVPPKGVQVIVAAIESCYEGDGGPFGRLRAH